ncbi:MAG: ornithine cyclodeaminase family protein [Betaproteobacteria bacterium]
MIDAPILYLSEDDVAGTGVSLDRLREVVAAAFAAQARGTAQVAPKSVLPLGPGHVFQAKPGVLRDAGLAGMKWFGLVPSEQTTGPSICSLIVLSDIATGRTLAIMGGDTITATRTAAMSAIAARSLARADSVTIGFIGCGVQAASHLNALRRILPQLADVVAYSRTAASAARFVESARAQGLKAHAVAAPRDAVEGLDVIVSTVPEGTGTLEFLDPAWLAPGAFVAAVDLGRSWDRTGFGKLDILATDEHAQSRMMAAIGRMPYAGPYAADLADIASGTFAGRTSPAQRAMFMFSGHALADLAAAQAVYEVALARGLGIRLPR